MTNKSIDNLVKKRNKFQEIHDFSKYSIEEIEEIIGDHSTIELVDICGNDSAAIKWFYSPLPSLNNLIPNEYCKLGNKYTEKIKEEVSNIYNNNFQI